MSSLLLRGFVLGFAVAASPGPIFFLCVRRTVVSGRAIGLFSGFGVATVDAFYAAIATFGVALLASVFDAGRRPLAIAGGLVLVVLGLRILFGRPPETSGARATARHLAWAYASTVALTITNPATILSFAALAATLGLGTSGSLLRPASVTLGVLLGSAAWWCVLVAGASLLRSRITPPAVRAISTFSGGAIAVLGILAVLSAL